MDENKFLPKLSQNLLEILDDDEYYYIPIEVEFLDKVYPYKKILPKELRKSLIKCYLNNYYNTNSELESEIIKEISYGNIDSKIITIQHAELISKWIDRLEFMDKIKNLYEFKLILHGSRDGFTTKKLIQICDNQSHTITIIKNEKKAIKNSLWANIWCPNLRISSGDKIILATLELIINTIFHGQREHAKEVDSFVREAFNISDRFLLY
ncbi:hypothetical protein C1645_816757 [Glomus cerebriforme]|uniref:TLDc domain-containing protein n=1 Tax=Glomus cerebriforme TaxID=658196 RepID=A0A397TG04_9GLOM|nr:hypothetical protein C1645_816757 [Glomus cerebriforme]